MSWGLLQVQGDWGLDSGIFLREKSREWGQKSRHTNICRVREKVSRGMPVDRREVGHVKEKGVACVSIHIHGPPPGEPANYMRKSHRQTCLVLIHNIIADSVLWRQSAPRPALPQMLPTKRKMALIKFSVRI